MKNITREKRSDSRDADQVARQLEEMFPRLMMYLVRLGHGLPKSASSLSPQQLKMLTALDMAGRPMRMTELAVALGITQGAFSTVSKRMVSSGLILRQRSPEDDRVVHLSLSSRGAAIVKGIREQRYRMYQKVSAELNPAQREKLLESHRNLLETYQELLADRKDAKSASSKK